MATDVGVQYFSHLNGLTLSNNWGDLIRLLDTCLVNGLALTSITSATIDAQGDITLNLYAAHNCMLFQIVELVGFAPSELNGKYRIKGTPSATQLILKATHVGKSISTVGTAKLASLGYDIIFRDTNDVKRVYRAKNPTAQHPFIRVDESLTSPDGTTGVYTSTYAKSAMVGLIENMSHIDDYLDPNKLQLPLDTSDFSKNWKINGTGTTVMRGWSKWYWCTLPDAIITSMSETSAPSTLNRSFTIVGNKDAIYLLNSRASAGYFKLIQGAGLIKTNIQSIQPSWFLMTTPRNMAANASQNLGSEAATTPLTGSSAGSKILATSAVAVSSVSNHTYYNPVLPSFRSGIDTVFGGSVIGALEIPIYDDSAILRGTLPVIAYSGKSHGTIVASTPLIAENSMYVYDALTPSSNGSGGGIYFYLGELE